MCFCFFFFSNINYDLAGVWNNFYIGAERDNNNHVHCGLCLVLNT